MKTKKILQEVLSEIKPKSRKIKEVDDFIRNLKSRIKQLKISARAIAGGSFAKDTFLKEDHDVDIFVLFDMKYKDEDLSKHLGKILKPFKIESVHGSRDYYKIKNKLNFEIVPVLDIKKPEDAQNVTDFSPAHVRWFNKNGKKYKDDVRLAKKFCKAMNVYGAESYIKGFSGHVLDILIVNYKGFIPLLKSAVKWKPKQVIDFYKIYKGKALFEINKSKTEGNLIVIDPVQPERNAAAALSDEKLKIFVESAKRFLKKPSKTFFIEKKADKEKLKKKGFIVLDVKPKKGKEDVTGAKLLKAFSFLEKGLEEFKIKKAGWEWDKKNNAFMWFSTESKKLPEKIEWEGPPLTMDNAVKQFKKKHKKTFTKKGKVYAVLKRKNLTPESLLKNLTKKKYFKEKVEKCTLY